MKRARVTPDKLNDVMELDHVIRVHADGTVSDVDDIWAPDLHDGTLSDCRNTWTLMNGYSSQYGYAGPIMHQSESIGGQMARDILAEPGVYVALVDIPLSDPDDPEAAAPEPDGWAVAMLVETRVLNRDQTSGYKVLMGEIRMQDFADPYATGNTWAVAIADVLYVRFGNDSTDYCVQGLTVKDLEGEYAPCRVLDFLDEGFVTEDDLLKVFTVMDRYRVWAKAVRDQF